MSVKKDSIPVIKKTAVYSTFEHVKGNRKLNQSHIKRLEEAIGEDANVIKYNPILVNNRFEIIDGQHRFEAIKNLNLPVYYMEVDGLDLHDAQNLNKLSKPWNPTDYAKSYADLGNTSYAAYLDLKREFGLNHDILLRYISLDEPITGEMFRSGKLVCYDFAQTFNMCSDLVEIGKFYPRYKTRSFALAFKQIWDNDKYSQDRMIKKLEQKPNSIEDRALPLDYIRDIEGLYNHGLPIADKVRFA